MLDTKLLERRIQYRNFYKDKYPTREKIEEIIQEAVNVSPLTTEIRDLIIDIYGPEHEEVKHDFMYTAVTTKEYKKSDQLRYGTFVSDDAWIESAKEHYKTHPHKFNRQLEAPYLLALRWATGNLPFSQKFIIFQAVGILGYALTLAANRHEIDSAFCRCYGGSSFLNVKENNLVKESETKPMLFIGMGYYNFDEKSLFKRDGDWIEHEEKGGRYNIVTRERDGYKKNKPTMDRMINWK
tara:strand:- start:23 stop:739 length:717 start_codon:yes stop_codon:yes gene_type:complete